MKEKFMFILLSLLFVVASVTSYIDMNKLRLNCNLVDATVIECSKVAIIERNGKTYYIQDFDVSFEQDNSSFKHSFVNEESTKAGVAVGDSVQIYVNKINPDNAYIKPSSTKTAIDYIVPSVFLFCACSLLVIGIFNKEVEED